MKNTGTILPDEQKTETKQTNETYQPVPRPAYPMYHAKKDGKGAASKWEYNSKKNALYLMMANQVGVNDKGNGIFGWSRWNDATNSFDINESVSMSLSLTDISDILMVIYGRKNKAGSDKGLYHENANGHSILEFSSYEKDGKLACYYLQIRTKGKNDQQYFIVKHSVSLEESEVLRLFLERAVQAMCGW